MPTLKSWKTTHIHSNMSCPSCLAYVCSVSARKWTEWNELLNIHLMDDSQREQACPFHTPKIWHFCPQAAPGTMPQNHKPASGPEKISALPLSPWWVSPRHHHSWQLFIQPAVEDGWCWRLPHSLDNLHQGFTIGKFFQVSELKPSCCNPTTISSPWTGKSE